MCAYQIFKIATSLSGSFLPRMVSNVHLKMAKSVFLFYFRHCLFAVLAWPGQPAYIDVSILFNSSLWVSIQPPSDPY